MSGSTPKISNRIWNGTSFTILLLVFCVGLVVSMAIQVIDKIEDLSTANSDNIQWNLSQADVEMLRLRLSLAQAEQDPADLSLLRRHFDVFYSRVSTLENTHLFDEIPGGSALDQDLSAVRAFLDETVPYIDGSDTALLNALPDIAAGAQSVSGNLRAFSLNALTGFTQLSDERRESIVSLLITLAAVLVFVFAGVVLLGIARFRLARLAEWRASEVQKTATRMQTIVDASLDAIVVSDLDGRIREFNPAASHIFGHTRDEVIGTDAIDTLLPKDVAKRLRTGRPHFFSQRRRPVAEERHFELTAIDKSGRRFPAEVSIDRADFGQDHLYVAYFRDISARKSNERALMDARDRALTGERAKAEFLAVMSHEMRTPLNGLLGSMDLMRDHQMTERQFDLLDRMQSSGRLLLGLVNDVLDLAKFEAGKVVADPRAFSLDGLIDGVIRTAAPLAAQNDNSLEWQRIGPSVDDQLMGDSRRLRQVLLNLIGNAIKFTRNGAVTVEVERLAGDVYEFRVIDTGIGIAEADQERIFNDFETLDSTYSRETGGTGLGLGISRRFVSMMGGEIGVESEPGEGSLFWFRIPLSPAQESQPVLSGKGQKATPARSLHVLLVEDNEINRLVAREMLEAEGHQVTEAVNGRSGVELAQSHPFDAVLMDISMPIMDGLEATRAIRSGPGTSRDIPIIALTAHALPEEVARFKAAGMNDVLSKPLNRGALMRKLLAKAGDTDLSGGTGNVRLIDPAVLNSLMQVLEGRAAVGHFGKFIVATEAMISALSTMDPAAPGLRDKVHECSGTCGTFGLVALRLALVSIETDLKQGNRPNQQDLSALSDIWADSRAALERWMAERV